MDLKRPHDSFFTQLMSDLEMVRDFLEGFLPSPLSEMIDFDSLRLADTEKTDRKYWKLYLDLSVGCKLSGSESELYIVFEHKSYHDRFSLIQILGYMTAVWEENIKNEEKLKPIIPLIFYHGRSKFSLPTVFGDYFEVDKTVRDFLLDFRLVLFDTNQHSDEEILQTCNSFQLAASLLAMKHIFKEIDSFKPVFRHLVRLDRDRLMLVLDYIVTTRDLSEEELAELIKEAGGGTMPSLAQRWVEQGMQQGIQEGIQQGVQQGIQQGMQQGSGQVLLRLLKKKFGRIPAAVKLKIEKADEDKIMLWSEMILTAARMEEIFAD